MRTHHDLRKTRPGHPRTRLEELIERFNTRGQAKFYIEHAGGDFGDYESEHDAYQRSLDGLQRDLDFGLQRQLVERTPRADLHVRPT